MLLGPSGCGKTTILNLLAGFEKATTGTIKMGGRLVSGPGVERPVIFQGDDSLLGWLSAIENIEFGLRLSGMAKDQRRQKADKALNLVGLAGQGDKFPHQLSGGMKQRIQIARALVGAADALLMDEPFGALDLLTRDKLNDELADIWAKTGKTIVLVTHSVEEAAYLSDRVVVMSARPGVVKRIYIVPFERPRSEATKLLPEFHRLMADLRQDLK